MDPDACLAALLDACATQDRDAARSHLSDLYQWIVMGGFLPSDPRKPDIFDMHETRRIVAP